MATDEEDNWWDEDRFYSHLVRSALSIACDEQSSNFVGVGQTPYWYLQAAKLLDANGESNNTYNSVAFSGKYVQEGEIREGVKAYPPEDFLNEVKTAKYDEYKSYLREHGLSPADIVKQFEEGGKKTFFVDYYSSGRSIASFLGFMAAWAECEGIKFGNFQSAVGVKLLHSSDRLFEFNTLQIGPYSFGVENIGAGPLITQIAINTSKEERTLPKINLAHPDFTKPTGVHTELIQSKLSTAVSYMLRTQRMDGHECSFEHREL